MLAYSNRNKDNMKLKNLAYKRSDKSYKENLTSEWILNLEPKFSLWRNYWQKSSKPLFLFNIFYTVKYRKGWNINLSIIIRILWWIQIKILASLNSTLRVINHLKINIRKTFNRFNKYKSIKNRSWLYGYDFILYLRRWNDRWLMCKTYRRGLIIRSQSF